MNGTHQSAFALVCIMAFVFTFGCGEEGGRTAQLTLDFGLPTDAIVAMGSGTRADGQLDEPVDARVSMDARIPVDTAVVNEPIVDADVTGVRAFTTTEADERIEQDCGGCHTTGGTGRSRRLGWDNMSYQLVYLSVKDPWTASSTRMPQGGNTGPRQTLNGFVCCMYPSVSAARLTNKARLQMR